MDKNYLLKRLKELGAEFIHKVDSNGFTVYRNLPLGLGFINVWHNNGVYGFIDHNWSITSGRMIDSEILTDLSLDNLE